MRNLTKYLPEYFKMFISVWLNKSFFFLPKTILYCTVKDQVNDLSWATNMELQPQPTKNVQATAASAALTHCLLTTVNLGLDLEIHYSLGVSKIQLSAMHYLKGKGLHMTLTNTYQLLLLFLKTNPKST